jgi:Flp pilus assembly protein TadB
MNNLWRGIILVVGSIFLFSVVIFRPEFLKSVRRSGSKYQLSRLGAASCGAALLAIGIAGILNGLAMISGVYVQSIIVLAITQLLVVGFYDTYRKSRLGSHSPFYVRPPKDESRNKKMVFFFLVTLPLIVVFASIIHFVFPTLDTVNLKFYAVLGIILLAFLIFFVMNWRLKRTMKKFHAEKKKALDRIGANDKNGKG